VEARKAVRGIKSQRTPKNQVSARRRRKEWQQRAQRKRDEGRKQQREGRRQGQGEHMATAGTAGPRTRSDLEPIYQEMTLDKAKARAQGPPQKPQARVCQTWGVLKMGRYGLEHARGSQGANRDPSSWGGSPSPQIQAGPCGMTAAGENICSYQKN
jgi:hypothetical protein